MTRKDVIEREILIAAPPEKVRRFLLEAELMGRWIGYRHTLDPRPGGTFRIEMDEGRIAAGRYTEVTPLRIAFTWGFEGRADLPPGASLVEIELVPQAGGTLVRLRHSGLSERAPSPFDLAGHGERWQRYLARLATTLNPEDAMQVAQERDTTTIRHTVTFKASPNDVYETLMDSAKHQALSGEKATISREVGGTFKAWSEHLSGFNLVLEPGRRIVQAWRAHDWWPDHYSIATFELRAVAGGTELKFTQIGVPPHRFDGHTRGWIETYWRPMQELLEKGRLSDETRGANAAARERIDKGGPL